MATGLLADALRRRGQDVEVLATDRTPVSATADEAAARAASADLVAVTTADAAAIDASTGLPTESTVAQRRLVRAVHDSGTPLIVVAVRSPYDVAWLDAAPTSLATYGDTPASIEALVRVLFGDVDPTGRLPVTIPRADGSGVLYPYGHGLGHGGG